MLRRILPAVGVVVAILIATACGNDDTGDTPGNSSFGGSSGTSGGLGDAAVDDLLNGCATSTTKAEITPLDLYVMFDTSGSMGSPLNQMTTTTKIDATRDAMKSFFEDPASAGIGVGIQFFPLVQKGVPDHCASNNDCPAGSGPCSLMKCSNDTSNGVVVWCTTQNDCTTAGVGGNCAGALRCTKNADAWVNECKNGGTSCSGPNSNVGALCPYGWGNAEPQTDPAIGGYVCGYRFSCKASDYDPPAVEIAPLPGVATQLENALAGQPTIGSTPTSAALKAASDHSIAYLASHAGHSVVTILVTDGLPTWETAAPTTCDVNPDNIAGIAADALTKGVRTYVIGVFASVEVGMAKPVLAKISKAGGTSDPLIVEVGANTAKDFGAAMQEIRGAALPCDYVLPNAQGGTPDFNKVNVRHTDPMGNKELFAYTKSSAACDPTQGGWYYDIDPSTGGTPTKLTLCPATCTEVKSSGGQVDVVLGCQTFIR